MPSDRIHLYGLVTCKASNPMSSYGLGGVYFADTGKAPLLNEVRFRSLIGVGMVMMRILMTS